jgi:hypothetical protein
LRLLFCPHRFSHEGARVTGPVPGSDVRCCGCYFIRFQYVGPPGEGYPKSEDQPDAKQITHAPQPEMRSAWEIERGPLPIASDAERPMPDARREVSGSTEGE